jgi:DNA-binding CsgD family transcriptional regulator
MNRNHQLNWYFNKGTNQKGAVFIPPLNLLPLWHLFFLLDFSIIFCHNIERIFYIMTHILLIFDAQSMLTLEDDQPAAKLVEIINQGRWNPPPPVNQLLGNLKENCLRAVVLGNWVIVSLEDPQEQPRTNLPIEILLTPREREVLELLSQGLTSKQIGTQLNLSLRTVNMHIANLKAKFKSETNAQSVGRATALGYCRPHMRKRRN